MAIAVYPDGLVPSTATLTLLAANDAVVLPVSGNDWATVQWTVTAAGSGGITVEFTSDAGPTKTNWLTPPMSVLTSTVAANPSTAAWTNATPVAGTYETPIPGNCTAFRVRYQTAGTATTVSLIGGKRYVPGVPVVATLSDVTEGSIGAGISSSTTPVDISGWSSIMVYGLSPTTQSVATRPIDDAGAALGNTYTFTAASTGALTITKTGSVSAGNNIGAGATVCTVWVTRRIAAYLPAGGTVSAGRIIVQAWR